MTNSAPKEIELPALECDMPKWECFADPAYYDMCAVRNTGDKRFESAFHVSSKREAEALRDLLNAEPKADADVWIAEFKENGQWKPRPGLCPMSRADAEELARAGRFDLVGDYFRVMPYVRASLTREREKDDLLRVTEGAGMFWKQRADDLQQRAEKAVEILEKASVNSGIINISKRVREAITTINRRITK